MNISYAIRCLLFLLLAFIPVKRSLAQDTIYYWVEFTDKDGTPFSIERPEEFLSAKAIQRRELHDIEIEEEDLPVTPFYIQKLKDLDLQLINISKWFNGAIISSTNPAIVDELEALSFVKPSPVVIKHERAMKSSEWNKKLKHSNPQLTENYGLADVQLEMLNANALHGNGFTGRGELIAIFDAGFTNADSLSSLQHIWNDNRVIAIRDYVKDGKDIFNSHPHGTVIFSIIGGFEEQLFYSAAPHADYALVRTEDGETEYIIEEYNWLVGAEFADSLGADIITSSLGYSLFDDSLQNHSYADMDGNSTPVTRAAEIAFSKGMLVVSSAGNSGGPPWYKITAPSDGANVICVGAVDSAEVISGFSSRGPSYDGRIKPDICALGVKTISQHPVGSYYYCSGTSCSAPLISGMAACLWQAYPQATNAEIMTAILRSGSMFLRPDTVYGYGIPDFLIASRTLEQIIDSAVVQTAELFVFPNPFNEKLYIEIRLPQEQSPKPAYIELYDIFGRMVFRDEITLQPDYVIYKSEEIQFLATGNYTLRYRSGNEIQHFSVTKIKAD